MRNINRIVIVLGVSLTFVASVDAGFVGPALNVPEGGGALALLAVGFGALAFLRRKLTK